MIMEKVINFTGAQGTGKTSVLNALKKDPDFAGFEFVTEVVRNFVKEKGIAINKQGTIQTQELLFEAYSNVLDKSNPYVSDRCIVDVCAYTSSGRDLSINSENSTYEVNFAWRRLVEEQKKKIVEMKNSLGLVCYFPVEFDLVDDGVRSIDPEYQKEIDNKIHQILHGNMISHLIVHGSVEERVAQIKKHLFNK